MGKELPDTMGKRQSNGGCTVSPCAACKLLRRRCAPSCVFAPYFPAEEPQKFANVHRVFGASNVNKILQEIPVGQRSDAVSSLVYEANARVRDPVYGCVAAISSLQRQIDILQAQLALTQAEMVRLRLHLHAVYLNQPTSTATATTAAAQFSGSTGFSSAVTTPSDVAADVAEENSLFGLDLVFEHAMLASPCGLTTMT
ncbi:hypothetical protein HPP92_011936 [Vanilla planifolia]|uniref:LOB domain-containing protein n=1 Tax=Vanilla planifolia TaxID=51239 RepID=A0A835V1E9_VANPL|nr:hypothetical protein HPP92_012286 [Vanilla planifolia]KAG0483774.1 hypothetical protein HPP92_011858 [Vanilla planifolia]KAG0483852.1 hypothetical protein HPP92_011936 [Vanilla planifolia]